MSGAQIRRPWSWRKMDVDPTGREGAMQVCKQENDSVRFEFENISAGSGM